MKNSRLVVGLIGVLLGGCSQQTDWAKAVCRMVESSKAIVIECQGHSIPMSETDMNAFREALRKVQDSPALSPRQPASSRTATAKTTSGPGDEVVTFVVSMDGKDLLVDWSNKTVTFNDTWQMPEELQTVLEEHVERLNEDLKATR